MSAAKAKPKVKNQKGNSVLQSKPIHSSPRKISTARSPIVHPQEKIVGPHQKYLAGTKPFQVVKELTTNFDISIKDMASVLDVTPKTFSRWRGKENVMSEQQADRMLILKSIFDLGRKVLGSDANVKKWIREPIFSLDGEIPLRLLKTESGRRRVESVLHQIEYGFF